ncbi:hypothetical protein RS9916_36477 [Synechococcus sp. RS9916]|nr:hypothetical protein RS9916_36477 [Synechococcus sp. RS9916]
MQRVKDEEILWNAPCRPPVRFGTMR